MAPATARPLNSKVVLVQPVLPHYRQAFLNELTRRLGEDLIIFAGTEPWDGRPVPLAQVNHAVRTGKTYFFFNRRVAWQRGAVRLALRGEVAILPLHPRFLSSWVILVARRLAKRPTVLWGHAWPRAGPASKSDRIRHLMRRCATVIVTYTEKEAEALRRLMPDARVNAAPNSLYARRHIAPVLSERASFDFVYVGRLIEAKKPDLLLDGFCQAAPELDSKHRLVIAGDGPLRGQLERRIRETGLAERVELPGHVSDRDGLRKLYSTALASVSPGYVGLSAIQSFSFGVPMLVARDEPHSPEIEAVEPGFNGEFFEAGSATSLAQGLLRMAQNAEELTRRRTEISRVCAERYSVETMAAGLLAGVTSAKNGRSSRRKGGRCPSKSS
jgi:glycosyltransferase involved in cell wall biosynthesis